MNEQEEAIRRELGEKQLLTGDRAERLIELSHTYREKVIRGAKLINEKPTTPEDAKRQFQARRKIIEAIVRRMDIYPDKSIQVYTEIDLAENTGEGEFSTSPIDRRRE